MAIIYIYSFVPCTMHLLAGCGYIISTAVLHEMKRDRIVVGA